MMLTRSVTNFKSFASGISLTQLGCLLRKKLLAAHLAAYYAGLTLFPPFPPLRFIIIGYGLNSENGDCEYTYSCEHLITT